MISIGVEESNSDGELSKSGVKKIEFGDEWVTEVMMSAPTCLVVADRAESSAPSASHDVAPIMLLPRQSFLPPLLSSLGGSFTSIQTFENNAHEVYLIMCGRYVLYLVCFNNVLHISLAMTDAL